jgi:hypothetical protein
MATAALADEDGSPKKTKQGGFKTMPFILGDLLLLPQNFPLIRSQFKQTFHRYF